MPMDIHESALLARAVKLFQERRYQLAEQTCQQILARNKNAVETLEMLSELMILSRREADEVVCLQRAVNLRPKSAHFRIRLGRAHLALGQYPEAIAKLEEAIKLEPANASADTLLADALHKQGDTDKARAVLARYIEAGTEDTVMADVWAGIELDAGRAKQAADILAKHVERGPVHYHLLFTLGKAYEKIGEIDKSFEAYRLANTTVPSGFNLDAFIKHVESLLQVFSSENLKTYPRAKSTSSLPIFVSGRPRSGTTLVESILSAHPDVHAAGELGILRNITSTMSAEIGSTLAYPQCLRDL